MADLGAARSRLATRESFFGGPISTRELCKAPHWQDLLKQEAEARAKPAPAAGKRDGWGSSKGAARPVAPPRARSPDPGLLRREKIKQRRDFAGLNDDNDSDSAPKPGPSSLGRPAPAAAGAASRGSLAGKAASGFSAKQQQGSQRNGEAAARAAGGAAPLAQPQKLGSAAARSLSTAAAAKGLMPARNGLGVSSAAGARGKGGERASNHVVVVKAGAGGKGAKGAGSRKLAIEPTAVGKSRKQVASEALQARCDQMRAESGRPASRQPPASPTGPSSSAAPSPLPAVAAAAAAAARQVRDAPTAMKGVMQKQHQQTGLGMQTQLLIRRTAAQQALHAARAGTGASTGPSGPAAGAAGAAGGGGGKLKWGRLSPQQQRWVLEQRRKEQQAAARASAGQGRPAFYGSKQPVGALDAVQRAKRRLSIDSQESLDDFIVDEDEEGDYKEEELEGYNEGDWRAELKSVLGGYDPAKFAEVDRLPDRDMEAGFSDIAREEARSKRIAREEDAREEELERLREANKREKKRRKKGAAAFFDDD